MAGSGQKVWRSSPLAPLSKARALPLFGIVTRVDIGGDLFVAVRDRLAPVEETIGTSVGVPVKDALPK